MVVCQSSRTDITFFFLWNFIAECIWIGFVLLVLGNSSSLTWLVFTGLWEFTFVLLDIYQAQIYYNFYDLVEQKSHFFLGFVASMFTKFIWETFGNRLKNDIADQRNHKWGNTKIFFSLLNEILNLYIELICLLLIDLQWQFGYKSCFIRNHWLVYTRLVLGYAYIWDS